MNTEKTTMAKALGLNVIEPAFNTYYRFEIYTFNDVEVNEGIYKNAKIGTISGWDIQIVGVKANNYKEAKEKLKNYPLFDCVITNEGNEDLKASFDFIKYDNGCLTYTAV